MMLDNAHTHPTKYECLGPNSRKVRILLVNGMSSTFKLSRDSSFLVSIHLVDLLFKEHRENSTGVSRLFERK